MTAPVDMSGQRHGRLLVMGRSKWRHKRDMAVWDCQCDCGTIVMVLGVRLRRGETRSCGCLRSEVSRAQWYIVRPAKYPRRYRGKI